MTSVPGEAEPQRGFLRKDVIEWAAGGATLIVAVLYGYGWLVLAQFYGAFEVNPEDVGVTFAFVTVRVALVMAVLVMVVAVAVLPLRALARRRLDGTRLPQMVPLPLVQSWRADISAGRNIGTYVVVILVVILAGLWALLVLGLVILVVFNAVVQLLGLDVRNPAAANVVGILFFATGIAIVLLLAGIYQLYEHVRHGSISLRRPARLLIGFLLASVVGVLAAGIWLLPRAMADTVRGRGLGATVPFLPLVGLRADGVRVSTTDGAPVSPRLPGGCVRLLGFANGVTVLFDPAQQLLVRVPTERLLIQQPCL